jgi:glycerate kinase
MVTHLDAALAHFAEIIIRDLGADVSKLPGAGAAGGLGAGLMAFLDGKLRPGAEIVLEAVGFEQHLADADLVLTGEGSMDYQTVYEKAPIVVAKTANAHDIPVISISGSLGKGFQKVHQHGICAGIAITQKPMTLDEASANAAALISDATEQAIRILTTGQRINH